jgi:hypothetical protein
MPTPIPALAPVDRPLSCCTAIYMVPSAPVLVAAVEEVPLAQNSLVSVFVQMAPLLQHPPPRLLAQLNWLVVHPEGTSETKVVPGTAVETQDEMAQPKPREQHAPPRLEGHLNALYAAHARPQQAGMRVVVVTVAVAEFVVARDVMVDVVLHKYWVSAHVVSHCLPRGQQEGSPVDWT